MSGTMITVAIVTALVAITIWVLAGGSGGGQSTTTAPTPAAGNPACQTAGGSNCVQAAQDLVQGLNSQPPAQPSGP